MPHQKGARPYHFGNLREALIHAGLELIAERGVKALTLREIGKRLGVSRTAPYRHFTDKAALLAAIAQIGFTKFAATLDAAAKKGTDHFERLEELGVAYVRFAYENQAHFEVMFGLGRNMEGSDESGSFLILVKTIADGQAAGQIRGNDPIPVAKLVWALVHGVSLLGFEKEAQEGAHFTRFCARLLRSGLEALQ